MLSVHFQRNALDLGLLPAGDVFKQMVRVAILSGIVGRVDVNEVRLDPSHEQIGVLVVAEVIFVIIIACERDGKLKASFKFAASDIRIVMTAGIGDLVHRVKKGRDEDRALARIDVLVFEIDLNILTDKADLTAIRK